MKSVKFQYLLVRLKDETEKGLKALIAEFQYLLVRLKAKRSAYQDVVIPFQYLLVRLKGNLGPQGIARVLHFNTSWYD